MTIDETIARIEIHKLAHKMNEPRAIYISEALDMGIKALKLVKYIEQMYEEERNKCREYYADGRFHSLSLSDGALFALRQVLDKWKENLEE